MLKRPWTAEESAYLAARYPHDSTQSIADRLGRRLSQVYNRAHAHGLKKTAAYLSSEASGRINKQTDAQKLHRFKPGVTPWNKGIAWDSGGRSAETRFKPGTVPPNRQEVGALRINSDGQLDIKLAPGLRQWKALSHYVWFLETGEWPAKGMLLRFKNGDVHDPRMDNLELLTRRENMLRNSVHTNYPPEIVKLVQLRGAIHRQIRSRQQQTGMQA